MRTAAAAAAILVSVGCGGSDQAVYVDLAALSRAKAPSQESALAWPGIKPLPSQSGSLPPLRGAQFGLAATRERLQEARRLLGENRENALRSLESALYRAYADQAAIERLAAFESTERDAQVLRDRADALVSQRFRELADTRGPLAVRLAFLIGFPFAEPSARLGAATGADRTRLEQATRAWTTILAQESEFASDVRRILAAAEAEVSQRRSQVLIDFSRSLNEASERARREAQATVIQQLPDAMGRFAEEADVAIPSVSRQSLVFGAIAGTPNLWKRRLESPERALPGKLEHDLSIWLAQNGYRRASRTEGAPNRTREFEAWLKSRDNGR